MAKLFKRHPFYTFSIFIPKKSMPRKHNSEKIVHCVATVRIIQWIAKCVPISSKKKEQQHNTTQHNDHEIIYVNCWLKKSENEMK